MPWPTIIRAKHHGRVFHWAESNMNARTMRHVRLVVEQLEARCVPAYLVYAPQDLTIKSTNDNSRVQGFQLQAAIVTSSDRYGTPDEQWQAVQSAPTTFQQVQAPSRAEFDAVF